MTIDKIIQMVGFGQKSVQFIEPELGEKKKELVVG